MQSAFKVGMFLALSALSVSHAQNSDPAAQPPSMIQSTSQGAPIERGYPDGNRGRGVQSFDSQPAGGVFVRSDRNNGVQTVTTSGPDTELRVVQGKANVTIHHPADRSRILVDMPGGQVSLLKDGIYTFNAATNTVRVLHGEAEARNGTNDNAKGTKIKETQQLAFFGNAKLRAVNAYPYELTADLMPGGRRGDGVGEGPYRSGFYGDYAGAYGYPYGYGFDGFGYGGYPYGYGYGLGLGFGYYGGGFGGYRGGFGGGGFRGGGGSHR
jgi:hypothetical protein